MRRAILVAGLVAVARPAAAQEVPARLTLEDALRIAEANNATYLQAANDVDVAEAGERAAFGQLLPNLDATLSFGVTGRRSLTGNGDFGEIVESETYVETTNSSASQGLSTGLTLFDGGRNINGWRSARASTDAAVAGVEQAALDLRERVATAYYTALRQVQSVDIEEQLLASAEDGYDLTRQRYEVGGVGLEDLLGAEETMLAQEQTLNRTRAEARKARLTLLAEMGVHGEPEFELVDPLPAVFDPGLLDADALIASAVESSPRVRQRESQLRASELETSVARGLRLPSISLRADISRGIGRPEYDALFDFSPPNRSHSLGISLSLPIFNRFQTSQQIASAKASEADARAAARQERIAVGREVRAAYVDLTNAYANVELADRRLELSQQRLALTQERYRNGSANFVALQQAIDRAAGAERAAIEARFGFVTALITLETKVGREVRP